MTHTGEPVPFVIYDSRVKKEKKDYAFNESLLRRKNIKVFERGYKLMDYFIRKKTVR